MERLREAFNRPEDKTPIVAEKKSVDTKYNHEIINVEENRQKERNMENRKSKQDCFKQHKMYFKTISENPAPKRRNFRYYYYFFISICLSFILGLSIGVFLTSSSEYRIQEISKINSLSSQENYESKSVGRSLNSVKDNNIESVILEKKRHFRNGLFSTVTFTGNTDKMKYKKDMYPKEMPKDLMEILKDNKVTSHTNSLLAIKNNTFIPGNKTVLYNNIYWGPEIENSLPKGYDDESVNIFEKYINQAEIVKMETGCGRMQNRLVTFSDGVQACVRYRQNTDQIQGEIFSFYVAKLLNLTNLAPSVVKIVDVKDDLWKNVANDINKAQWSSNRAVVITQYIPSLEVANIPDIFKPTSRHLNKFDVFNISVKENDTITKQSIVLDKVRGKVSKSNIDKTEDFDHLDMVLNVKTTNSFVELAQWSDLIIFDYLTANLDRIVNNLFNYQWNANIMDGPAHNLAKKIDNGLLMFLDNESGLLHGYRLLKKYNMYHSLMLDNLCMFRQNTVDRLKSLYEGHDVGRRISNMFHEKNDVVIRDILPPLPDKNAKILHERIARVLSQVQKCEQSFAKR